MNWRDDLRLLGGLLLVWTINAVVFWINVKLVGGSAFFSELPYDRPPFIQVGHERVQVSRFVHELSFWHGFSVFFGAACLIIMAALLAVAHGVVWVRTVLMSLTESW